MDAKTIANIIAIVSPTITLTLTILAILNSRIEKSTTPLDTPSLKILTIKRHPVSQEELLKVVKNSRNFIWFVALFTTATLIALLISILTGNGHNIYIAIGAIIMCASIAAASYFVVGRYKLITIVVVEPFNLFSSVDIIIEADFQYLFDKCIDALKSMNLKISQVELGDSEGKVKALRTSQIKIFAPIITITVTVQKIENSESSFTVQLSFFREFKTPYINAFESSKITNSFIDRLISKSTKA
ncbi:MAG TPA: hypothetical protein VEP90_30720 [Methylomirabilota bacterium]|nr:hypothetical protein [Methylomirabilota bacterium]